MGKRTCTQFHTTHMQDIGRKIIKSDLSKIVSDSKHLSNEEQSMFYHVRTKYEFPFDGNLGT